MQVAQIRQRYVVSANCQKNSKKKKPEMGNLPIDEYVIIRPFTSLCFVKINRVAYEAFIADFLIIENSAKNCQNTLFSM